MKQLIIAFLLLLGQNLSFAQQPGNYTLTITTVDPLLNGDDIDIYFHVPDTYSPSTSSRMIIGFHGLGNPDNSEQIRNYLSPLGDSINAIVVCPDPYLQDQPRSEMVLHLAYDSVLTWFNIDTNQVYITGYSAGSDVAAQYFFGEPEHKMKGLIWHSPGFFFGPDLSNPNDIPPVCLCTGTLDFTSIIQTNLLNGNLEGGGFPYLYNSIPGVDHTMEYPTFTQEMLECINFIDMNSSNVGINNVVERSIQVYPNPICADQPLVLKGLSGDFSISLVNTQGQAIWNKRFNGVSEQLRIDDFRDLITPGIYFLKLQSESRNRTQKIIFN